MPDRCRASTVWTVSSQRLAVRWTRETRVPLRTPTTAIATKRTSHDWAESTDMPVAAPTGPRRRATNIAEASPPVGP
jgi:hypothetical protein